METCPMCGKEMVDHGGPQDPFYICEDCGCDECGLEIGWCDCGTPYICGDDPRCDCDKEEEDE